MNHWTLKMSLCLMACFTFDRAWAGTSGHFQKVVWLVFENASYDEVIHQKDFHQMAGYGVELKNMFAEIHPSQGNYIAMIAGSDLGIDYDDPVSLPGSHIGDLLENAGMDWRVYAEDFPGNCFLGEESGKFVRKHVPFLSFTNVQKNPKRCQKIQSADHFMSDFQSGNLPEFSMYIPNMDHDGHETDVGFAGRWLSSHFGAILSKPDNLKDVLFILTFDESESTFDNNQIYTVLIGAHTLQGTQNAQVLNHISLLKMIEDEFHLGTLSREDALAPSLKQIWQ